MSDLNEAQLTQLYEDWTALGAKRERERIIKLLKEKLNCPECEMNGFENTTAADAIVLIEGASQKDNETVSLLTEGEK